eukprot:3417487-Pleurochrysis_carterae.AAC.1
MDGDRDAVTKRRSRISRASRVKFASETLRRAYKYQFRVVHGSFWYIYDTKRIDIVMVMVMASSCEDVSLRTP